MCVYEGEGVTVGRYMFVGEREREKQECKIHVYVEEGT
jgi:hypothetical protein